MEDEKNEITRLKEWQNLMEEYNNFFYADNGIFTISLFDKELKQYKLDFNYIKNLIEKLKKFEKKYGELYTDEKNELLKFKEILIDLDTDTNGIKTIYEKMSNIYDFIEDYWKDILKIPYKQTV